MGSPSGGEGPAILQLNKWCPSQAQLNLSEFREAFISPTRHILLLLSYQREALLLPLITGDSTHNNDLESSYAESSKYPGSFLKGSTVSSKSDSRDDMECTSGLEVDFDHGFSLESRSNSNTFIGDVKSLAWGISGDTYNLHEDTSSFREFLFVSGNHGVTVHAFCQPSRSTSMARTALEGDFGQGRWVEWGTSSIPAQRMEEQEASSLCCKPAGDVIDVNKADGNSEIPRNLSEGDDDLLRGIGSKTWFHSFFTKAECIKSDGTIWTRFPDKSSFPCSAEVVSFSLFNSNSPLLDFYFKGNSVSNKESWQETVLASENNTVMKSDLASSVANCKSDVVSDVFSVGVNSSHKCSRVFSSNSHHLIGFVFTLVDAVSVNPSDESERSKTSNLLLVARLENWGIQWVSSLKLEESLNIGPVAEWADFHFSDNLLVCLNESGLILFYTAMTGDYVACMNLLQICGLNPQSDLLEKEELSAGVDVKINNVDGVPEKSTYQHGCFGRRMFKRLFVDSHTSLLAVADEYGVIYVIHAGDYIPDKYYTSEKLLPHFQQSGLGMLVGWEVGGSDIGPQRGYSSYGNYLKFSNSSMMDGKFSCLDNIGSNVLQKTRDVNLHGERNQCDSCLSGFSASNTTDQRSRDAEVPSHTLRKILLSTCRFNEDDCICFSPLGITRFIKRRHLKNQKGPQIIHFDLRAESAVHDDSCLNGNKMFCLQGRKEAFIGEAVGAESILHERMDQTQHQRPVQASAQAPASASRAYQFHPARAAIVDLFDLYLGRSSRQKPEDSSREPPNKTQKRVHALNRELPPRNEQFLIDFEQLQSQFAEQDQLRSVTESIFISLVVKCSGHAPRAEFLLFALRNLCTIGFINWDTLLPSLLSSVSSAEMTVGSQAMPAVSSTSLPQTGMLPPSSSIPNPSTFQSSNPASPLTTVHGIGSPAQCALEPPSCATLSPVKSSDILCNGQQPMARINSSIRDNAISSLRQLCCKIILTGLEFDLKPVTHAEIFYHMLNWLVNWDQRQQGIDEFDGAKSWRPHKALIEWLHSCLDVIWLLVEEDKCRVPYYELLRSGLQFIENIPDDEALFTLILEIHRRRDMMAMHMQMLDQHLHCPTFGTHRVLSQTTPSISGEANARYSPITYPSVLGEPLHGEDLAMSIQKGSLDWERALRCIRHALRSTPSPDWWKRVLLVAPSYRSPQASTPGAVFTSEMICEATIDRIVELLKFTNSEINCWQEWLVFSDIFFFLMKSGCIDFVDFVDKLVSRVMEGDQHILRTNHVTWLLVQLLRVELVTNALNSDARKVETTRKVLSFHREDRSSDPNNPQSILLDFISSCQNLRIWSFNTSTREYLNNEQLQKGKQIDEWWRQVSKGDRMMDYMNMDDRSIGMFWVVSYTMAQPACETVMNWLSSAGVTEFLPGPNLQSNERLMVMREVSPLPMSLLCGFSMNLCLKLAHQMEETLFSGQGVPNIAMVETYTRLLLIAPHSLFRSHFSNLAQRNPSLLSKPGVTLLVLEILNYRLLPLYRYEGKSKALMYDVTKIISTLKGKRGDHRVFRLAENLCMNLIFSLRDFFPVKREGKGPTEFTETLNRITVITLAITIKTRGIADADHLLYLQTMLEQIMATSLHTWSEKTLRYFPSVLREALMGRMDKRSLEIQAWQKAETTVINQCTQLLSPSADPSYVTTYISHSFPMHRRYLCAGAWILMHGHPENINSINLARVLREFSPEDVTENIYTMVDVLVHHIQMELQHGHLSQDLVLKASANLTFFVWTHELLPLDILLLALIDRDDDPHALHIVINLLERQEILQRVKQYCVNHGPPEHWLQSGMFKRVELQKALGNHLSWKDRYPTFFDDAAARLLPVVPLIIYRLIENDATEPAEIILVKYSQFLALHPLRFTFVRDILAYFYGHLPGKLIVRILNVLDLSKIPFSESFPQHISSSNPVMCPPMDYFATLLLGLVNNVIPPLQNNSRFGSMCDPSGRTPYNKTAATSQSGLANASEGQKSFYQIQDPGTYTQLVLETAVIELLSLPVSASQIVSSLVQIVVNIQPTLIQSSNGLHGAPNGVGQASVLPTSPSGGSTDSLSAGRSTPLVSGINTSNIVSRSGYTCQQLSCLLIQACGLLLAQLPPEFHLQLYAEASRIIKESWWLTDGKRSLGELDSAVGYALLDPTWAAQDNTSTAIGNMVALLHSFFSNLPQEWLEGTHVIIKHLRPVTSVAMLRIAFRIMGPLLPRLANAHSLFNKTLSLLLSILVDVFGRNSQTSTPVEASEIADLIDFLHHVIHYEGQGGPVQANSKPRPEVLALCGRASENLRLDVQHLLSHLKADVNSSIYAATHPKLVQNPS